MGPKHCSKIEQNQCYFYLYVHHDRVGVDEETEIWKYMHYLFIRSLSRASAICGVCGDESESAIIFAILASVIEALWDPSELHLSRLYRVGDDGGHVSGRLIDAQLRPRRPLPDGPAHQTRRRSGSGRRHLAYLSRPPSRHGQSLQLAQC